MAPTQTGLELFSSLAVDPDLADLVDLFVAEMPQRIGQLLAEHEQGQWEQLRRTAHQLKGAAGSYGFHQLTPFAAGLEAAIRDSGSPEQILDCLHDLTDMCRSVRAGVPLQE